MGSTPKSQGSGIVWNWNGSWSSYDCSFSVLLIMIKASYCRGLPMLLIDRCGSIIRTKHILYPSSSFHLHPLPHWLSISITPSSLLRARPAPVAFRWTLSRPVAGELRMELVGGRPSEGDTHDEPSAGSRAKRSEKE